MTITIIFTIPFIKMKINEKQAAEPLFFLQRYSLFCVCNMFPKNINIVGLSWKIAV